MNLDPPSAAQFALVAACLVLLGAILTVGPVTVEQRGAVLGGIVLILGTIAWRRRRNGG